MKDSRFSDEAIEAARSFAEAISAEPLDDLGGILSPAVGTWRLRNQIKLMLRAKERLEKAGIEPDRVRPETLLNLIDNAGKCGDETLGEMFVALLASHLDGDRKGFMHPSFSTVLAQLSPADAELVFAFRKGISDPKYRAMGFRGSAMTVGVIADTLECTEQVAFVLAINLQRLGIIYRVGAKPPEGHPLPDIFEDSQEHQEYRITEYGIAFCDCVTP